MPFMEQSQSNQLLLSCSRSQRITDDFLYRFHVHHVRKRMMIRKTQIQPLYEKHTMLLSIHFQRNIAGS
jgi:hypothetical protein